MTKINSRRLVSAVAVAGMTLSLGACKTPNFGDYVPNISLGNSSGYSQEVARDLGFLGVTQKKSFDELAKKVCSNEEVLKKSYKITDSKPQEDLETKLVKEENKDKGWFDSLRSSFSNTLEKATEVVSSSSEYDIEKCKTDITSTLGNSFIEMDRMIKYNIKTNGLGSAIPTPNWYLSSTTSEDERMNFSTKISTEMLSKRGLNGDNVGYNMFLRNVSLMYAGLGRNQIKMNNRIELRDDLIALVVDAAVIGVATGLGASGAVAGGSNPLVTVGKQTGTTLGKVIGGTTN